MRRASALVTTLLAAACPPSLSSFQPAHVAPAGHSQAQPGGDGAVRVGTISTTLDAAKTLATAAQSRSLGPEERRDVFEAGVNLALDPPSLVSHIGVTYTPFERWEVGIRRTSGAWRLGVRRQIFDVASNGWDLTVGLGGQRFAYEFPVQDVVSILVLEDFVRWSVDVPIVAGTHGNWYRLWGGPRIIWSTFDTRLHLELPAVPGSPAETVLASADG